MPGNNECFVGADGIVYDISSGDQAAQDAVENVAAIRAAMVGATTTKLLADLTDVSGISREARAIYRDFAMEITGPEADPQWTICFAGGNPFIRTVVKFIMVAAGRRQGVGFQSTREAARSWLLAAD